jgi:hypothetical protein
MVKLARGIAGSEALLSAAAATAQPFLCMYLDAPVTCAPTHPAYLCGELSGAADNPSATTNNTQSGTGLQVLLPTTRYQGSAHDALSQTSYKSSSSANVGSHPQYHYCLLRRTHCSRAPMKAASKSHKGMSGPSRCEAEGALGARSPLDAVVVDVAGAGSSAKPASLSRRWCSIMAASRSHMPCSMCTPVHTTSHA